MENLGADGTEHMNDGKANIIACTYQTTLKQNSTEAGGSKIRLHLGTRKALHDTK
jgi:hypothetical protein